MNTELLESLLNASKNAPQIFRETPYWAKYRQEILEEVKKMDITALRSGRHPRLASFGFGEFSPKRSFYNRAKDTVKLLWKYFFLGQPYTSPPLAPYSLTTRDVQEMAYRHCELLGLLTGSKPIATLETSRFGNPSDIFEINGKPYTMAFLEYYTRYCFVHKATGLTGNEVIVELGSGSGHQAEIIKKIHAGMTILCFDLPVQLFLCEQYLTNVIGKEQIVSAAETLHWQDLSKVRKGAIHFFGNWQFPLLKDYSFDLFWNAASFGEMEPEVVQNYLSYVLGNATWIYLLQISQGKLRVTQKIRFEDYDSWVKGYELKEKQDAYQAHRKLVEEGPYFQAVWKQR